MQGSFECRSPSQRSLPDLVSKPLSPANFTQPSLDTFTADCDVLDRAVETVDAGKEHSAGEKEGAEEAPAKAAASMDKQESKQHSKEEEHTDKRGAAAEESAEKAVSKVDKADKKPEGKPEKPAQQATKGKAAPDTAAGAAGAAAAAAQAECKPKEAPAAEQQSSESKPEHKTEATAAKKETESKPKESTAVENQAGESKPEATAASGEGKGEEESTKKKAPVSDEQEAILKRGDSLLKEADQHEPRNIQLVRRMQVRLLDLLQNCSPGLVASSICMEGSYCLQASGYSYRSRTVPKSVCARWTLIALQLAHLETTLCPLS